MSNFIVSARKYRPETFKSVVGQDAITSTLKNAIKGNHIGHAYLFYGPRGVGKTTCARILAKTLNCSDPGPDTEPCNVCESCIAFNNSRSFNIHELDAASNNSIDDIRLLIDKVRIPPQLGKYSVYIIDEVHMLSVSAFNAFLKTLEEPPLHAIFILATTEKHKIIPTILSRCQIFDFNRIKIKDIVSYLSDIADRENIIHDPEALHMIAEKADGSMRDALTVFDQVVSYRSGSVKYKDIIEILNILDYEYYFRISDAFIQADTSKALLIFDEILNRGFDAQNFISGLGRHFRDLLVSKDEETVKLLEVSDNFKAKYLKQAEQCPDEFIFSALNICSEADLNYKQSKNQRLHTELAIINLSRLSAEKKKSDLIPRDKLSKEYSPKQKEENFKAEEGSIQKLKETSESKVQNPFNPEQGSTGSSLITEKSGIKKNLIKSPGISIKHIISSPEPEETGEIETDDQAPSPSSFEEEENETLEENQFSIDELIQKWREYADLISNDRPRMAIILKNRMPEINEGYEIRISFDNAVQMDEFNQNIRSGLMTFLKRELKNSYIRISSGLEEKENNKKILYTPEEQFQYLSRKNPSLNKLKQQFNLDFE